MAACQVGLQSYLTLLDPTCDLETEARRGPLKSRDVQKDGPCLLPQAGREILDGAGVVVIQSRCGPNQVAPGRTTVVIRQNGSKVPGQTAGSSWEPAASVPGSASRL